MIMVSESKDRSGEFPQITNIGDSALMVLIGEGVNPVINNVVHEVVRKIRDSEWPGIREVVPVYSSFVVHYDPFKLSPVPLATFIEEIYEFICYNG